MSETRKTAEGNAGAFLTPDMGGGGMIAVPMNVLSSGSDEPEPEDEWQFPTEPLDETAPVGVKPVKSELPQGPTHKG